MLDSVEERKREKGKPSIHSHARERGGCCAMWSVLMVTAVTWPALKPAHAVPQYIWKQNTHRP